MHEREQEQNKAMTWTKLARYMAHQVSLKCPPDPKNQSTKHARLLAKANRLVEVAEAIDKCENSMAEHLETVVVRSKDAETLLRWRETENGWTATPGLHGPSLWMMGDLTQAARKLGELANKRDVLIYWVWKPQYDELCAELGIANADG